MSSPMKPPRPDIVERAVALLLSGVQQENPIDPRQLDSMSPMNALDRQIGFCDAALASINSQLHAKATALQRRRNSYTPISKLPIEILTKVLLMEHHSYLSDRSVWRLKNKRRHELALVARAWANAILDTAAFWTDIQFDKEDLPIPVIIRRSKTAPLYVAVDADDSIWNTRQDLSSFHQQLSCHSHRWHSMHIMASAFYADPTVNFLESPSPALEDLAVSFLPIPTPEIGIRPQIGPALRHLLLQNASIPWESCPLSNLKSLQLRRLSENPPSLHQLLGILLSSPELERLAIDEVPIQGRIDLAPHDPRQHRISLPALRSLFLGEMPTNVKKHLMATLQSAPDCSLFLTNAVDEDFLINKTSRSPLLEIARAALRKAESITVTNHIADGEIWIRTEAWPKQRHWTTWREQWDDEGVSIRVHVASSTFGSMRSVCRFLRAVRVTASVVVYATGFLAERQLFHHLQMAFFPAEVLDDLPTTEEITVGSYEDALNILHHLTHPRLSDGQWPCPMLKTLDLRTVQGLVEEDIADFEAGRWGVGSDGTQEGQPLRQRPRRLENLLLPSTLNALEDDVDIVESGSDVE